MRQIKVFIEVFLLWIVIGIISKVLFIALYHSLIDASVAEYAKMLLYGFILDASIAGYLTIIPGLILTVCLWDNGKKNKARQWVWDGYFLTTAFISSVAYVCNLGLYGYWGFPLDSTPLLYLKTSPEDAFASLTWWQWIVGPLAIIVFTMGIWWMMHRLLKSQDIPVCQTKGKVGFSVLLLTLTAALIIPIRGGFGTGTNHTGSVYFSNNIRLNHAAVNPIFSFMESVNHQVDMDNQYRFMDREALSKYSNRLIYTRLRPKDAKLALPAKTNVIVIMLESFSKYIMSEKIHVHDVVPNLEMLSREGIYFSNIYANSTRTDRAIVSIQSGLPAQPTMSVMDMPHISTSLPSIAKSLGKSGYTIHFYYGGDTNYSNMNSYLVGTGFKDITSEEDFSSEKRICKWGVPDEFVYERMLSDISNTSSDKPFYMAMMTESSHEPFDVPYKSKQQSEILNAFEYADKCLGEFINALKKTTIWNNTLVVLIPDHLGAYPKEIDNYALWRYEIPLILTGGAASTLKTHMVSNPSTSNITTTIGSQIDITATILGLLQIDHSDFKFSKDLFDPHAPHFAFFDFPDAMGIISTKGRILYDNTTQKPIWKEGNTEDLENQAKAYLQLLYDYIISKRH